MSQVVLAMQGVVKHKGAGAAQKAILNGVDLSLKSGEVAALYGSSGSGKSTLLSIAAGLDVEHGGTVTLSGMSYKSLGVAERSRVRGQRVGMLFQQYNLVQSMTVEANIRLSGHFIHRTAGASVAELLNKVGLDGFESRWPATLSGGEQQRVALARALYGSPKLLVCDEPTGSLDAETGASLTKLIRSVASADCAVLVVTHDEKLRAFADTVYRLKGGLLACD